MPRKGVSLCLLPLDTTTSLVTPILSIGWLGSFGEICFTNFLKSTWIGNLVRLFSSSRQSDRADLHWAEWNLVGRLFQMQALIQSIKAHLGPGPIGCSLRALVFKSTYLSAGLICESRLHNATCFLLGVSSLFQHVWSHNYLF